MMKSKAGNRSGTGLQSCFRDRKGDEKFIYVENNKRGALLTLTTMNFQAAAVAKAKVLVKRETLHLYLPYLIHLSRRDLSLIDSMSHRFDSSSRAYVKRGCTWFRHPMSLAKKIQMTTATTACLLRGIHVRYGCDPSSSTCLWTHKTVRCQRANK